MEILLIIFLILVGFLLLLLEFVVIPGTTIAGIGGLLFFIAGVYLAFNTYGILAGIISSLVIIILVPVLFYKVFKSKTGKKMILDSKITGNVNTIDTSTLHVGDEGLAVTRLASFGRIKINGQIMEAHTITDFIDAKTHIKITNISSDGIIVEPLN